MITVRTLTSSLMAALLAIAIAPLAFAKEGGRLSVTWERLNEQLAFVWRESGIVTAFRYALPAAPHR